MTRVSPIFAGLFLVISFVPTFSLAIFSTASLISFSLTFTIGLVISSIDKSGTSKSGISSTNSFAFKSLPSSNDTISILG